MKDLALSKRLVMTVPSSRQLAWQELEFTAFFHYGINSFTNREWGDGQEDIQIFNPKAMNTDQWCEGLCSAGIRACIITAKHHDGFCLWDTAYTDHSVMHTPYGKDIVAQLSKSCEKYGIRFGIYLSPWDRHEAIYGQGKAYDDYFCNQLTELLTKYGPVYTVWFDGACGEGPNGKKQQYDWDRYYALIRKLQPEAVISVCGPDVRWCGNEAGDCRPSEWSVVPAGLFSQSRIAEASQQSDDESFRSRKLTKQDQDLGSRELMEKEDAFIWYPAEVNTSIRPGWFHHDEEDDKVRSLDTLLHIYLHSVGGNSVLLLNIPPHRDGYLAASDMKRLEEIGDFLNETFRDNLATKARIQATNPTPGYEPEHIVKEDLTYYRPTGCPEAEDMMPCVVDCTWKEPQEIGWVILKEQIRESQRVESFLLEVETENGAMETVYEGTVIGYKKICHLKPVRTRHLRIRFTSYRIYPTLQYLGVYKA